MKKQISSHLRKNYIINNIITNSEWKHIFVKEDEIPKCDLKNKILYLVPFSNKDDIVTEKIIYYYSLHENAHAAFTPFLDYNFPMLLCKIINVIEDLRVEKMLNETYNTEEIIKFGNMFLINKAREKELNSTEKILLTVFSRSLNVDLKIELNEIEKEIIEKTFPTFERWKEIPYGKVSSFRQVIKISKEIYDIILKCGYNFEKETTSMIKTIECEDILYKNIYENIKKNHNNSRLIDSSKDNIMIPIENSDSFYSDFKNRTTYNVLNVYKRITKDIIKKINKKHNQDHGSIDYRKIVSISKNLDKNIFTKNIKTKKTDICFSIVLDQSNSMKKYFSENIKEVIQLCNFFEEIQVDFQVIGSNTEKPNELKEDFIRTVPVNYYVYKEFFEKFKKTKYRMTNFDIKYHFIDNEIIDSCCKNMIDQKHIKNILILFSDGDPKSGQNVDEIMKEMLLEKIKFWKSKNVDFICCSFNKESISIYENDFIFLEKNSDNNSYKIIDKIKKYLI